MKENLKKFIVSFENMILKRWKTSTFSRFFVKKFLFWPSIFNYLKNELTSRIWFFMWKKTFFWRKNFLFEREKKRKKFNFFYWFFEYDPIHNLKEIIKFSKKMGFQNNRWKRISRYFEIWKFLCNEKGHRLD